jgi:hypothetical protein
MKKFATYVSDIGGQIQKLEGASVKDEGIRMLKNRIDDLDARVGSSIDILNGLMRLAKEAKSSGIAPEAVALIAAAVKEGLGPSHEDVVTRLGRLFNVVADLKQSVTTATAEMSKVSAAIATQEEDRIGQALRQIAGLKQNLAAVEELLMEHMSKKP